MRVIVYLSILVSFLACQSKNETSQNQAQTDTVASADIQNTNDTEELLTFGFSNENGDEILAFEEGLKTNNFTQTIDNQGT